MILGPENKQGKSKEHKTCPQVLRSLHLGAVPASASSFQTSLADHTASPGGLSYHTALPGETYFSRWWPLFLSHNCLQPFFPHANSNRFRFFISF